VSANSSAMMRAKWPSSGINGVSWLLLLEHGFDSQANVLGDLPEFA